MGVPACAVMGFGRQAWKEVRLEGETVYAGNSLQAYSGISLNLYND